MDFVVKLILENTCPLKCKFYWRFVLIRSLATNSRILEAAIFIEYIKIDIHKYSWNHITFTHLFIMQFCKSCDFDAFKRRKDNMNVIVSNSILFKIMFSFVRIHSFSVDTYLFYLYSLYLITQQNIKRVMFVNKDMNKTWTSLSRPNHFQKRLKECGERSWNAKYQGQQMTLR